MNEFTNPKDICKESDNPRWVVVRFSAMDSRICKIFRFFVSIQAAAGRRIWLRRVGYIRKLMFRVD